MIASLIYNPIFLVILAFHVSIATTLLVIPQVASNHTISPHATYHSEHNQLLDARAESIVPTSTIFVTHTVTHFNTKSSPSGADQPNPEFLDGITGQNLDGVPVSQFLKHEENLVPIEAKLVSIESQLHTVTLTQLGDDSTLFAGTIDLDGISSTQTPTPNTVSERSTTYITITQMPIHTITSTKYLESTVTHETVVYGSPIVVYKTFAPTYITFTPGVSPTPIYTPSPSPQPPSPTCTVTVVRDCPDESQSSLPGSTTVIITGKPTSTITLTQVHTISISINEDDTVESNADSSTSNVKAILIGDLPDSPSPFSSFIDPNSGKTVTELVVPSYTPSSVSVPSDVLASATQYGLGYHVGSNGTFQSNSASTNMARDLPTMLIIGIICGILSAAIF